MPVLLIVDNELMKRQNEIMEITEIVNELKIAQLAFYAPCINGDFR